MAPIRRYLRISKYSVLECRIYLDNPALAQPWLLNPRNPVLPRVIESVRPLVLPKLREEKERSRKRSTKKKGIKDVVVEDDFEVSIFLTETNTRHSLVTKHKHFHDTTQTKLTSNSGRLVGASHDAPIDVDLRAAAAAPITLLEESDSEDAAATGLAAIPTAPAAADDADVATAPRRRPKRVRTNTIGAEPDAHEQGAESDLEMVSSDDAAPGPGSPGRQPPTKRRRAAVDADTEGEDKKKLALDISYEGFSIYGRVLCLVVKRRERPNASTTGGAWGGNTSRARQDAAAGGGGGGGQAMMENFIISTQVPAGAEADAGPVPQGQAN